MKKYIRFLLVFVVIGLGFLLCKNTFMSNPVKYIAANPDRGFHYGYYYYIPQNLKNNGQGTYLLIEPNNTGFPSDDKKVFQDNAKNILESKKSMAEELGCILLVPTFERPQSNDLMYTHALDRDTLLNNTGSLARIDLQLINIIDDISTLCLRKGIAIEPKIMMDGFSASGTFVNRFVALHPEIVKAAVSGGVNSMPILPLNTMNGECLIYPVGISDIEEITGTPFNLDQYVTVPQLIYMGEEDDNDTLPYDDAFGEEEKRMILIVLDKDMKKRWALSKQIYEMQGCSAVEFTTYQGVGHEITDKIERDIVQFFKNHMN